MSLYTETFTGTMGGWRDRDVGKFTLTNLVTGGNPDGCLQASFPANPSMPEPDPDAIVATGLTSTANFIGNYLDVDALLVGFDFYAADFVDTNTNRSSYRINLYSGTTLFWHRFDEVIAETGVWYKVRASLVSPEAGKWTNVIGNFSSLMTNVTRLEISIDRTQFDASEVYKVDNVFLDRLPAAVALNMATSRVDVTWLNMRAGESYRFESATDLVQGDWVLVSNVTASGGAQVLWHDSTNAFQGYRVVIP